MNRALFITFGIVTIIFALIVWLFLFFNGTPASTSEVFADLGIINPTERPEVVESGEDNRIILNFKEGQLQQVTTNPVAGFAIASTTDEKLILRYVERGTGYIYDINLESGLQALATPSTLPGAVEAYFAPDLSKVVVVSERGGRQVTLIELPHTTQVEPARTTLPTDAENIQFTDDNTLTYTQNSHTVTIGYTYTLNNQTTSERVRIPVPDATVLTTENNRIYAYPKPTSLLPGALYEIKLDELTPISEMVLGLVPFVHDDFSIINQINGETYRSYRVPNNNALTVIMLPEKCTAGAVVDHVWCGVPTQTPNQDYVEGWYKGIFNSDDVLMDINTLSGEATTLAVPKTITGRQIDITHLSADPTNKHLLFINKIDSTLWLLNL